MRRPPQPRQPVLTFDNRCPRVFGMIPDCPYSDVDVIIAYHASQGAGGHYWHAPDRAPLYAIDGRPC